MENLSPEAISRLRAVQDHLRAGQTAQLKFSMNSWVHFLDIDEAWIRPSTPGVEFAAGDIAYLPEGFCGTSGCIAGTLVIQAGYRPVVSDYGVTDSTFVCPSTGKVGLVVDLSRKLLGKSTYADQLFIPWDYPGNPFWKGLDTNNPDHAIIAIERFIELDGVGMTKADFDQGDFGSYDDVCDCPECIAEREGVSI